MPGKRKIKNPFISVITVCRNSEKTIAKTMESVLAQTYRNYEYIIIDGASEDRTLKIVQSYRKKFRGKMRLISERDRGLYDAMNKGIDIAKGDIVGMINSDDRYEPGTLKLVAESYRKNGAAVYYGILRYYEDGRELMLKTLNYRFLHREMIQHPTCFVANEIYRKAGKFSLRYKYAADFDIMLRFLQKGVRFVQIDSILANFNAGGETSIHEMETLDEFLQIKYRHGYLTRSGMILRMLKNRILFFMRGKL
jgi:glycosyltransferase involved in cell wall biosynthesis